MRGDIVIIGKHHTHAAEEILKIMLPVIQSKQGKFLFTVGGESGAGKSEIAYALEKALETYDIKGLIIQQDDYFVHPPKTNEQVRHKNIKWVGTGEVKLDLLNENIREILAGKPEIRKPLVIFAEDRIISEKISLTPYHVVIIDGTYTTLLENIDCRIFIDRDRNDTREDRLKRNREQQSDYLEKILEIEHLIISRHKALANIVVDKKFNVTKTG